MKMNNHTHVLLVEDDPISGFLAEQVLKHHPKSPVYHWVKNGQDALDWLEQNSASCILLDLSMPVMDGFEMLEYLQRQELCSALNIVILTSSNREADRRKSEQFPCVKGFIEKPLTEEKLDVVLERVKVKTS